jgi:hypothetical protein
VLSGGRRGRGGVRARVAQTTVYSRRYLTHTLASPAFAFQCPKLVAEIQTKTAQRYDPTASAAKVSAVEAQSLHAAGKHAESEKLAKDTLEKLK